jgi:hypothetical protein
MRKIIKLIRLSEFLAYPLDLSGLLYVRWAVASSQQDLYSNRFHRILSVLALCYTYINQTGPSRHVFLSSPTFLFM